MSTPTPTPARTPGWTVVGAGAIGGTLAHHLARAGHPVDVVDADPEHVAAIARDGISLLRDDSRSTVRVRSASCPPDGPRRVDRVLLAVKSQATHAALDWVAPRLADDGFVVSLQNGLNEDAVAARVGGHRTVGAFVNLFADVVGPGEVRDGGHGALVVGETDGSASARVDSVVADLQAWGPARATTNVAGHLWSKLGFGAMLAATSLADAPMADLVDRHRGVMHALAAEVYGVSAGLGVRLEAFDAYDPSPYASGDPAERDAATDRLVAWLHTQAKDRSGIWRDLAVRHRPTEVPAQYAPVLLAAAHTATQTPLLSALLREIDDLEHGGTMSEQRLVRLAGVPA